MKFYSFVEASFSKADADPADGKGGKMWVEGIASNSRRDADKQILKAEGFELDYLMNHGFFNWHHGASKSAALVIGEPTESRVVDGQLFVKGFLYDSSPKAREVYDLGRTLEKDSSRRRLGFSIEGKALAFDPQDPSVITKAVIKHVAITFAPKNVDTGMVITKADDDGEDFGVDYSNSEPELIGFSPVSEGPADDSLTKSELLLELFTQYDDMTFEKAEGIYEIARQIDAMRLGAENG